MSRDGQRRPGEDYAATGEQVNEPLGSNSQQTAQDGIPMLNGSYGVFAWVAFPRRQRCGRSNRQRAFDRKSAPQPNSAEDVESRRVAVRCFDVWEYVPRTIAIYLRQSCERC